MARGVVALAVIGVGLFLAALLGTEETLAPSRRRPNALGRAFGDVRQLVRSRHFVAYALAGSFGFAALFSYISASSFVYQDVFGLSAQLYAVLFATNGLILMGSNVANRHLVTRIDPHRLLLSGLALVSLAGLALAAATIAGAGAGVVLPLVPLVALGTGLTIPNTIALAMEREGARAGSASALFGTLQFTLGALVAPLVGIAGTSAVPMGVAIAASALLALASFLLLAPVWWPRSEQPGRSG
jgi:MFS transporter, DHA1 family, multidrug resistance protein